MPHPRVGHPERHGHGEDGQIRQDHHRVHRGRQVGGREQEGEDCGPGGDRDARQDAGVDAGEAAGLQGRQDPGLRRGGSDDGHGRAQGGLAQDHEAPQEQHQADAAGSALLRDVQRARQGLQHQGGAKREPDLPPGARTVAGCDQAAQGVRQQHRGEGDLAQGEDLPVLRQNRPDHHLRANARGVQAPDAHHERGRLQVHRDRGRHGAQRPRPRREGVPRRPHQDSHLHRRPLPRPRRLHRDARHQLRHARGAQQPAGAQLRDLSPPHR
mmetsp:Transcript_4360/g.19542  ORF Transcript_4360/g.19542 Transcript_4360/m.19542 type:complete len:269 (+) Transcript_4360:488-1294(+)